MKRIFVVTGALCLLFASGVSLDAGATKKKKDVLNIRIHGEATPQDGEKFSVPFTLLNGTKTYLSIMPVLSEHEVRSILPFKNPDGSLGVFLYLDAHGANLLAEYSIEKMGRGSMLAVMVNGRQVIDLEVDKPVRDGVVYIPYGLTMEEEARLVNAFPLAGQKGKKAPLSPTNIMLPPKASDISGASAPAH
jgi:hypothetical protein